MEKISFINNHLRCRDALLWIFPLKSVKFQCFHPSINDITGASSSAQHTSTTPENHPLVLGGAPPVTAGGSQTSATLTVVSSPSGRYHCFFLFHQILWTDVAKWITSNSCHNAESLFLIKWKGFSQERFYDLSLH